MRGRGADGTENALHGHRNRALIVAIVLGKGNCDVRFKISKRFDVSELFQLRAL